MSPWRNGHLPWSLAQEHMHQDIISIKCKGRTFTLEKNVALRWINIVQLAEVFKSPVIGQDESWFDLVASAVIC